jgi:hypothetical protein
LGSLNIKRRRKIEQFEKKKDEKRERIGIVKRKRASKCKWGNNKDQKGTWEKRKCCALFHCSGGGGGAYYFETKYKPLLVTFKTMRSVNNVL